MYDYIIEKPELNEDTLAHYGIKGMKWKKHLKGKYYSLKSKAGEKITKQRRKRAGLDDSTISKTYSQKSYQGFGSPIKYAHGTGIRDTGRGRSEGDEFGLRSDGKSTSSYDRNDNFYYIGRGMNSPREKAAQVERGIAAGRERVKKKKK